MTLHTESWHNTSDTFWFEPSPKRGDCANLQGTTARTTSIYYFNIKVIALAIDRRTTMVLSLARWVHAFDRSNVRARQELPFV
jgi:hypothetical protein